MVLFIYNVYTITHKHPLLYAFLTISAVSLVAAIVLIIHQYNLDQDKHTQLGASQVLGDVAKNLPMARQLMASTPTPTPSPLPTPTIEDNSITFINVPNDMTQGDRATYTWTINGPAKTVRTTTVYYGTVSTPGILTTAATPADTHYTQALQDFISGDYVIPLQFIAGSVTSFVGTYYFRGYALIDGKHYWTNEYSFVVKQPPKNTIQIVAHPQNMSPGSTATFTWDIGGPAGIFPFTAIVAGKESKPGPLDESVTIDKTPYKILVNDFTNGSYNAPFRFIGNARIFELGVYYYRAIVYINGKNIWSDEYSLTVQ